MWAKFVSPASYSCSDDSLLTSSPSRRAPQIGFSKSSIPGAIWWAFITGAAIGYGDLYPATFGGRIAAIWTASLGILWCARAPAVFGGFSSRIHADISIRMSCFFLVYFPVLSGACRFFERRVFIRTFLFLFRWVKVSGCALFFGYFPLLTLSLYRPWTHLPRSLSLSLSQGGCHHCRRLLQPRVVSVRVAHD
jgi:hypothetical protein